MYMCATVGKYQKILKSETQNCEDSLYPSFLHLSSPLHLF